MFQGGVLQSWISTRLSDDLEFGSLITFVDASEVENCAVNVLGCTPCPHLYDAPDR